MTFVQYADYSFADARRDSVRLQRIGSASETVIYVAPNDVKLVAVLLTGTEAPAKLKRLDFRVDAELTKNEIMAWNDVLARAKAERAAGNI